jgi:hypothetical protein
MYRITIQISLNIHVAAKNIKGGNPKWLQTCYAGRKYYTNYTNSNQTVIQYDCKILQKKRRRRKYILPSKSIVHFRKPKICNFSLIIKQHQNGYELQPCSSL